MRRLFVVAVMAVSAPGLAQVSIEERAREADRALRERLELVGSRTVVLPAPVQAMALPQLARRFPPEPAKPVPIALQPAPRAPIDMAPPTPGGQGGKR